MIIFESITKTIDIKDSVDLYLIIPSFKNCFDVLHRIILSPLTLGNYAAPTTI